MGIAELLRQNEGKTLEFKRDLSSPDKVLKTIVAFANTAGGRVVIGVEDKTKQVRGVVDPLAEEERLANLVADRISPRLLPSIEIVAWRNLQILLVEVFPSSGRPHFLRELGTEEGSFVRLGSTNRKADRALLAEMRRMAANESFDETVCAEANSEAMDFRVASELLPKRAPLRAAERETLRLVTRQGRHQVPTVGGWLLLATDPTALFPDAWIQCGQFRGSDKSVLEDGEECRGPLPSALEKAYAFIERHARRGLVIKGLRNQEVSTVPLRACRELLVNAVVHADYSQSGAPIRVSMFVDRLEIENPGILLTGMTLEDVRQGVSRLRNRVIGRFFKEAGYIEQWGSGVQRATAECAAAGLPPPELEERGFRFRATLHLVSDRSPRLDAVDSRIRDLLGSAEIAAGEGGLSPAQLAKAVGLTSRAVRSRLARLMEQGLVFAVGKNERDPRRKYFWREAGS